MCSSLSFTSITIYLGITSLFEFASFSLLPLYFSQTADRSAVTSFLTATSSDWLLSAFSLCFLYYFKLLTPPLFWKSGFDFYNTILWFPSTFLTCYLVAQLCPTLCDCKDCSPPGSSVCGILQARRLASFLLPGMILTRDQTCVFCIGRQILYPWAGVEATFNHCVSVLVTSFSLSQLLCSLCDYCF